jgi:hypothetical protein
MLSPQERTLKYFPNTALANNSQKKIPVAQKRRWEIMITLDYNPN